MSKPGFSLAAKRRLDFSMSVFMAGIFALCLFMTIYTAARGHWLHTALFCAFAAASNWYGNHCWLMYRTTRA